MLDGAQSGIRHLYKFWPWCVWKLAIINDEKYPCRGRAFPAKSKGVLTCPIPNVRDRAGEGSCPYMYIFDFQCESAINSSSGKSCSSIHPSTGSASTGRRFCQMLKRRRRRVAAGLASDAEDSRG